MVQCRMQGPARCLANKDMTPPHTLLPGLADSHVHLNHVRFENDLEDVLERARIANVNTLIVPAVDANSWQSIRRLHHAKPSVYAAYGLHPLFLPAHRETHLTLLEHWLEGGEAIAMGEIGLDFHDISTNTQLQQHYFQKQLELARRHQLPVIVHARRALDQVIYNLRQSCVYGGVVHSFSGSWQQAVQLWDLGFYLGIGGPVTYPRAQRLRRIVSHMPLEWLLLESDAPDQPALQHRGQRNEPAFIRNTLSCIAQLRQQTEQTIAAATLANTRRLFKLEQDGH